MAPVARVEDLVQAAQIQGLTADNFLHLGNRKRCSSHVPGHHVCKSFNESVNHTVANVLDHYVRTDNPANLGSGRAEHGR